MAFREVEEQDGETKHLTLAREHLSVCSVHDPLEDPHPDPDAPAPAPAPTKPPAPGKLRRTALRFFGVRKSICLLPAIFGGRSKNQTKKRVGKSRTHDGLSKASCGDSPGSEGASGGSFGTLGRRDGVQGGASGDFYPAAEQKSQSFPRQKKGLRGLFHSIRLHRAQRNAEAESNEMTTLPSSVALGEVPAAAAAVVVVVVREDANRNECLGSLSSPEMPDGATLSDAAAVPPECNDRDTRAFAEQGPRDSLSFRDPIPDDHEDENTSTTLSGEYLDGAVVAHSESCPQLGLTPEAEPAARPPGSSDRLDLIFEDVASLKSFDSLTGCGDIIADQDDDSLAESTVSGERSRNAGKRSSCCLTYQGGGEEMASPDDLEADGLRDLWGETPGEEDMFCSSNTEPTSDLTSSQCGGGQQSSATDASTLTPDELTPQSEHQGSAPTSDEGYYDSITPGPEDAQAKLDRMGPTDRIPRDSYSGDALYELFVPEESLISPHYENGSGLGGSESCGYGLGSEGMADTAFLPELNPLEMGSNLYEDQDFPSVYDAVMCNESKEFAPFSKSFSGSRPQENANLNLTTQEFFNNNNRINLDPSRENGNILEPAERRLQSIHADSFGSVEDPDFTRFSPTFSDTKGSPDGNQPLPSSYSNPCSPGRDHADEGQTVCFSQALVDYTKHSQFLRDNADGLDSGSSLSPNMEALPTIVTFDVMDMHNEGEYDDQLREGLEEDGGSAPYPAFQESYLQKEDLARCDYQTLSSVYGQNRFGDAWTIASLPRHLGLPKAASASASERRSRSLDREGLERSAEEYPGSAAAGPVYPPADGGSHRAYPPHDTKNVHSGSAFEAPDGGGGSVVPWPAPASSRSAATDDQSEVKALRRAAARPSVRDYKSAASHRLPAGGARDTRQCAPRLPPGESGSPYSTFAFPDLTGSDLMTMVAASGESEGGVFYAPAFKVQTFGKK
ncbi:APC membrane recruitment protein 1-like [Gadus chalcogrammus]|uniref:APC membrane recruitment protein 1-like n=1 Tax=Gadus chalcogrammus TaxID=1042646 RepID=UPI0024C2B145|nr:APC membrane recruitment protein 1-like [Gadus chalcogrammus]